MPLVKIKKLVPGGDGLGILDDIIVLIPFVLPDELVEFKIVQKKKNFIIGKVIKILEPSPLRQNPVCKHFEKCGGCDFQHIVYEEQLRQKILMVKDAFERIGKLKIYPGEIVPSEPLHYRNRVQIHVNKKGEFGFMGKKSSEFIPIQSCPVAQPKISGLFETQMDYRNAILLKDRFQVFAKGDDVYFDSGANDVSVSSVRSSEEIIEIDLLGRKILLDVNCFFQSNLGLLEPFIEYIRADEQGQNALDLYCGVGLFSMYLEDRFKQIIAVESNKRSFAFATRNLTNPSQILLNCEVEQLSSSSLIRDKDFDLIVVDPPRTGLSRESVEFLLLKKAARLIYVSCNPTTLARDLPLLLASGYEVESWKLFDFYPQTAHVETVVKLIYKTLL